MIVCTLPRGSASPLAAPAESPSLGAQKRVRFLSGWHERHCRSDKLNKQNQAPYFRFAAVSAKP